VTVEARSEWRIWTTAKSELAAQRVYNRLVQELDQTLVNFRLEPHWDVGEYKLFFDLHIEGNAWNDCVVANIEIGQTIGNEWTLFGDIRHNPSAWSNKPKVVGVKAIEWELVGGMEPDNE
jgi:hypothetical protein